MYLVKPRLCVWELGGSTLSQSDKTSAFSQTKVSVHETFAVINQKASGGTVLCVVLTLSCKLARLIIQREKLLDEWTPSRLMSVNK